MGSPTNRGNASVTNVRLHDLKKLDDHTVRVPLLHPDGDLPARFVSFNSSIVVQNGATAASFSKPIGTGPFMVTGFTPPARPSVRNPNYWDHPKPYLDALNLTSILDDTARFNAVLGGQAQYCTPTPSRWPRQISTTAASSCSCRRAARRRSSTCASTRLRSPTTASARP